MLYGRNLKAYRNTGIRAEMSVSDPYNITKLLYQGLFARLAQAKGALVRGDLSTKAHLLAQSTAIIENLRSTIDFSYNKSIAQSLFDLYSFMLDRITSASLELNAVYIDEALRVLAPIKNAWEKIPQSARDEASALRKAPNEDFLAKGQV